MHKFIPVVDVDPAFSARANFILKELCDNKPKKILDAGCGRGFYVHQLSQYSYPREVIGVDVSVQYVEKAKRFTQDKRVRFIKGSIYTLPFSDNYFDAIIISEVLEHIKDEHKVLVEIHRVLKKGGLILITVPNQNFPFFWDPINWVLMRVFNTHINKNIWWLAGIWADHERLYNKKELTQLIKRFFSVQKVRSYTRWCWPLSHFLLYGIGKNIAEKNILFNTSRFSQKHNRIVNFVAFLFQIPSLLLDRNKPVAEGVSICLLGKK